MIIAHHIILSAYGFWLPNDPRGSWSDFVGAWKLFRYGPATKVTTHRSLAKNPHDRELRLTAKKALKYPAVRFHGLQARAIARGFARATNESECLVRACAVLHDHVHLVIARGQRDIAQVIAHLKGRASRQLSEEGLHPFPVSASERLSRDHLGRSFWDVFIDNDRHHRSAIRYVNDNPRKEGN